MSPCVTTYIYTFKNLEYMRFLSTLLYVVRGNVFVYKRELNDIVISVAKPELFGFSPFASAQFSYWLVIRGRTTFDLSPAVSLPTGRTSPGSHLRFPFVGVYRGISASGVVLQTKTKTRLVTS
jgi:hypothetical protein